MCRYSAVYLDTLLILGRMKVWVKSSLLRAPRPSAARTPFTKCKQKLKQLWLFSSNLRHTERKAVDRFLHLQVMVVVMMVVKAPWRRNTPV